MATPDVFVPPAVTGRLERFVGMGGEEHRAMRAVVDAGKQRKVVSADAVREAMYALEGLRESGMAPREDFPEIGRLLESLEEAIGEE